MVSGKHINRVKNMSLCQCVTLSLINAGRHLLGTSFLTSLKSHLYVAVTTCSTTKNKCIISHAQIMTELQSNVIQPEYIIQWSQKRTVHLLQRKPLPRSTANSSVSNSTSNVKMCRFRVTNNVFPFYC